MLEQGREQLHQAVLWIVHEFMMKLEENGLVDLSQVTQNIITVVSNHLKVNQSNATVWLGHNLKI